MKATCWQPNSWQKFRVTQQVNYASESELNTALETLSTLPPLVTKTEILKLQEQLAQAMQNKGFILQGGDCAENFSECNSHTIQNKLKILLQMSLVLIYGIKKPVTRIGRIAGQYAKPRSADNEIQNEVTLPSYRGDLINSPQFCAEARTPSTDRLLKAYYSSALTLNYLRALINSGFADLQHPEKWDLSFVTNAAQAEIYNKLVSSIGDVLSFIGTIDGLKQSTTKTVDFFTSHEALHLPYEQAATRLAGDGKWYNLSTHFPWLGMRTADLDAAHIEYFRGINNPIAVKIGPDASQAYLAELVSVLNPDNIPGRLTLITRMGYKNVADKLPKLINAVRKTKLDVLWMCDPMHGNTQFTDENIKTRHFDDILSELQQTMQILLKNNSHLAGVHFELTGENVTECIGGARGLSEHDLRRAYHSLVDPRLNYEQSLEMAMCIAKAHESLVCAT